MNIKERLDKLNSYTGPLEYISTYTHIQIYKNIWKFEKYESKINKT